MNNLPLLERVIIGSLCRRAFTPSIESRMAASSQACTLGNRLKKERSPYLLQHASNPVDWYPWGDEAFKEAKTQNKLIFLSVGYSTCHWCHVMERESFENEEIAKIMNEYFINIKVDREERPDVDKVYMTFVTAASGRGGWPMSVFLTPELIPVAGGTYFPPSDRYGTPGFKSMLNALAAKWKENESKFKESGSKIMEVLKRQSQVESHVSFSYKETIAKAYSQLARMYEPEYGGFGHSPKFPQPSNFNFLFAYRALNPDLDDAKKGLEMCLHTLRMMDRGGIHDHIAQGFARYSTDSKWHVPHFEKMLYDQAQLVFSYLDAFLAMKEERYARVVRDILTYVMRDLSHPLGGFYSAEDADSLPTADSAEKREGAFCVWTREEITEHLSPLPASESSDVTLDKVFSFHYSVVEGGNVDPYQDPHGELKNQNVLLVHGSLEETASEFGLSVEETMSALQRAREVLYEVRSKRPRPHLDDKMLTAWNGMMFGAMAEAGAVLAQEEYLARAIKSASFIKENLWKDGRLSRAAYRVSEESVSLGSDIDAFADDYAWVIRGLTHLYDASLDERWLLWAEELQERQNEIFWDSENGGYFLSKVEDESILLRLKEDQDGAEPSVNSVSSGNLLRLSRTLNRPDYEEKALAIFKAYSKRLQMAPVALPEMTKSLLLYMSPPEQIILSGERDSAPLREMLRVVHSTCLKPSRILLKADADPTSFLYDRHGSLRNFLPKSPAAEAVAYVCKDFTCSLPARSPEELRNILKRESRSASP